MLMENKVAIITGDESERGIGRAIARLFAEHGALAEETARLIGEQRGDGCKRWKHID